jgi:hypothetical protein
MKAKFQEFQYVEVDGAGTGYGDLVGYIVEIELSKVLGQPHHYHVRVYSGKTESVYVAEKFVRETERTQKIESLMNEKAL